MKKGFQTVEELLKAKGIQPQDLDGISWGVIEQLAKQNRKGRATYGHSLEDCPDDKYNWQEMANQELIDALQYYEKELQRIKKERDRYKQETEELGMLLDEYRGQ